MKKYIDKKLFIVLIIMIILIIVLYFITKDNNNNNNILVTNYVSNLETKDITMKIDACDIDNVLKENNVPYFKLENQIYKDINQDILTNFFLRTCYQDGQIDYDVSINNDILSLILTISYEEADDASYYEYKTYNLNLKNNTKITNEELLNKYNINIDTVNNIFISKLTDYYNYEKNNSRSELSFNQFLQEIDYQKITLDNINLYIDKDNKLYFYKTYKVTQLMAFDENYPEVITKFKLKELTN